MKGDVSFEGGMGLGAFAGLETDRLISREAGPTLAPVLLCWKVTGWVPLSPGM